MPLHSAAITAVILLLASAALGDPTTQPDKSQYTLFNPTPADQLRKMDTDRPNKTNTPHTIDAGHLQIEIGFFDYDYYRDQYDAANSRIETLDLGQFNFRLGILDNLELNAVINSFDLLRNTDYITNQSTRKTASATRSSAENSISGATKWMTPSGPPRSAFNPSSRSPPPAKISATATPNYSSDFHF